jgi:hypothetical protein
VTRERGKSAAKGGARKEPAGASQATAPQGASPGGTDADVPSKHKIWIAASVAVGIVVAIGIGFYLLNGIKSAGNAPVASGATFVGSDTCAGCHQAQARLWGGSHHKQAMDRANDKSVLGDFNEAGFDHYSVRSRFFRKDGKFLVETDGPDGTLAKEPQCRDGETL